VDEWKGRNVLIPSTSQILKVISNTSDTLTFGDNFSVTPSVGDKVGIISEIHISNSVHEDGGGATDTTTTDYEPFTLTIKKSGYKTYKSKFTLNKKFDEIITLSKVKDLNFSKLINIKTQ